MGVMGKADKQEMAGGGGEDAARGAAAAEVRINMRHPNVSAEEVRWLAGSLACFGGEELEALHVVVV